MKMTVELLVKSAIRRLYYILALQKTDGEIVIKYQFAVRLVRVNSTDLCDVPDIVMLQQTIRSKLPACPAGTPCNTLEAGQTVLSISGDFYDFTLLAILPVKPNKQILE